MSPPEEVELYFDYERPFAYLASGPAFALDARFAVRVRWIPIQLRIKAPKKGHDRLPFLAARLADAGLAR